MGSKRLNYELLGITLCCVFEQLLQNSANILYVMRIIVVQIRSARIKVKTLGKNQRLMRGPRQYVPVCVHTYTLRKIFFPHQRFKFVHEDR